MFDCDFAAVANGGPDGDGFAGDVPAPVQPHPARHRTCGVARKADLVLNLAVEGLLKCKSILYRVRHQNVKSTIETKLYNVRVKNVILTKFSYREDWRLQIQVDRVHNDKDLLILVGETVFLPESRFAKVLDPAMLAQKCGG